MSKRGRAENYFYKAAGTCAYCGKFFCEDCLVDVNGRHYCKDDVGKAFDESSKQNKEAQNVININNVASANATAGSSDIGFPRKNKIVALILCIFLGGLGIHRFYVGKAGSGVLYFFTCGVFGLGWIIDIILILVGGFSDKWGRPLV